MINPTSILQERERLVMQLGTGEAGRALKCAEIAAKDVRGIDVNMGCPLKFSTSSGAGSALLKKPETVRDIMTTLRRNLPEDIHVTCKIRLLATIEETIDLARTIEACGVSAIGVHGRYVSQKPREPAHRDLIKQIVESVRALSLRTGTYSNMETFRRCANKPAPRLQCLGVEQCGINQFFGRKDCFRKEKISRH